jgi:RHS repeat-associated protein
MGCLKLPYYEKEDRPNFLGLWKKSDGKENRIDYYPFGLTFNSFKRENSAKQNYLFNGGSELQTDLDLGFYSTLFRTYDPAIGRFMQIDPLADFFSGINPYSFAFDNPISYSDPDGLAPLWWLKFRANVKQAVYNMTGRGNQHAVIHGRNRGKAVEVGARTANRTMHKPTSSPSNNTPDTEEDDDRQLDLSTTVGKFPVDIPEPHIPGRVPDPQPQPLPKPKPKPTSPVATRQPDPTPLPYNIRPGGTTFDGYQFEPDKSDLYRTPANDKLISDLIIMLKSSSGVHLEIRGNVNADPSWFYGSHQKSLSSGRAQAIYNALRAAGIPASQLHVSPGEVRRKEGNMSATFKLTKQ